MKISVIIPTLGRKVLKYCLESVFAADTKKAELEVIVVDDTKASRAKKYLGQYFSRVNYLLSGGKGPAYCRNLGIEASSGEIIFFIGDDIIISPDFFTQHLKIYQQIPTEEICVVGKTVWDKRVKITPVMEVIERQGIWFNYRIIEDEKFFHEGFYTCNVSVKRETLGDLRFDEDFKYAAFEDTYMGYNLAKKGVKFVYNPEALAFHRHTWNLSQVYKREKILEKSKKIMLSKIDPHTLSYYRRQKPSCQGKPFRYRVFIVMVELLTCLRLFTVLDLLLRILWQKGKRDWVYTTTISIWDYKFAK